MHPAVWVWLETKRHLKGGPRVFPPVKLTERNADIVMNLRKLRIAFHRIREAVTRLVVALLADRSQAVLEKLF